MQVRYIKRKFSKTIMFEIIQIGVLVTLLRSQNMKNIQIYLKANLFVHTSSLELLTIK